MNNLILVLSLNAGLLTVCILYNSWWGKTKEEKGRFIIERDWKINATKNHKVLGKNYLKRRKFK